MTRGGLWLAAALLIAIPLDARCDDASGETIVMQDASGRIVVVPAKSAARAPKRISPVRSAVPAARMPAPAPAPARAAAPASDGVDACVANDSLVERWLAARQRVVAARRELEFCESIPLSGMGGYRDARIAGAERELERAEANEAEVDTRARDLGVPQHCFDDSSVHASDE